MTIKNGDMLATSQIIERGAGVREILHGVNDDFYNDKYNPKIVAIVIDSGANVINGMTTVSRESSLLDHTIILASKE